MEQRSFEYSSQAGQPMPESENIKTALAQSPGMLQNTDKK
jgi:hypothetical protein